jgi:hypothetical protein
VNARLSAVALACAAAAVTSPAIAQSRPSPVSPVPAILSVPYLPQSEALCGGAAAAMVMRYWGAEDIYADAFAPLVDRKAGGIHTSTLVADLERRQWVVAAGPGDGDQLARELARGRPVIALIEDRPGRFHYVVVVSLAPGTVTLHDPARAPSRTLDRARFDAAWERSQRWMLILLPPPAPASPGSAPGSGSQPGVPAADRRPDPAGAACASEVDAAVALAGRGEKGAARSALEAAAVTCPTAGAPWRELAGLDAIDERWADAAAHAQGAVLRDNGDALAWRILATAEYLQQHDLAALAAWNHAGEPRTDLVEIKGIAHTRYLVVADAIGLQPAQILTPDALLLAQRRVLAIPAVAGARVSFQPQEKGKARIDAAIIERSRAPATAGAWLGIGLRALTDRQIATAFANVSGGGDLVSIAWRFWEHRPMVAASYAAPGPGGVWRLDVSRETQTFGAAGPARFEETRARAGVEIDNWIDRRTRLGGGVAIENWTGRPRTAAISGRVEFRPFTDRLSIEGGTTIWRGRDVSFAGADAAARWRSTAALTGTVWRAGAGYRAATAEAPASIWPGADSGTVRDVLLRAHPLLDDGVIHGGVFGRRLAFGSLEVQRWFVPRTRPIRVAPAAFVDTARASRGLSASTDRLQVDAGAGIRLSLPGVGVLRLDLAHGLRDGRNALSVAWQR